MDEITTFGKAERLEGVISWDGAIVGLTDHDRFTLVGKNFELRLPSGHTGNAVLDTKFGNNYLHGSDMPPFD